MTDFQNFINGVYGVPDDRMFSIPDLLSNHERFTMRALKGLRKGDTKKLKANLLISFSWLMAIVNRLHINIENVTWERFPFCCSYCAKAPCQCKEIKPKKRKITPANTVLKPKTLHGFQRMFYEIYPPSKRSLQHAGVHLAEEIGEVSEAVYVFLGEHRELEFKEIQNEIADCISCFFAMANSADINVAKELAETFINNCHVCHNAPCTCNFSFIAKYRS